MPCRSSERARSESPSPVLKAKGTTFRAASSSPVGPSTSPPHHASTGGRILHRAGGLADADGNGDGECRTFFPSGRGSRQLGRCSESGSPAPSLRSSSSTAEEGRGILGVQIPPDEAGPTCPSNEAFLRCRPS
jgi:hypothetical protein